jgi:uncharacterized membrane protein YfcA
MNEMELAYTTYAVAAGMIFVISLVFAMLGLGGGMLYVPVLKWLEFPVKAVAIPVGLLLNGLNTLFAFIRYAREGLVDFRGGLPAALAALLLAPVGAWSVTFVPVQTLLLLFALAVAVAGMRSLLSAGQGEPKSLMPARRRMGIGAVVGGFAGFIGGLLGLGGGFIIAPMLMEMGYPTKEAAATTAFIVTFSSFSGFLGHMAEGRIDPWLAGVTVVMVILGSQLGAWFMATKARPEWVKRLYGVVLLGVAAKLLHGLLSESE